METRSTSLSAAAEVSIALTLWQSFLQSASQLTSLVFGSAEVALRVVDSAEIARLNALYRGVPAATDVLSFPALELVEPLPRYASRRLAGHVGDIALCWDAVCAQAQANGNTPHAEACALFAHSLLHLAGYDHLSEADQERMDKLTVELCKRAGVEVEHFGH